MAQITNRKNFYFSTLNGEDLMIYCETYEYYNGWGHRATIVCDGNKWPNFTKRQTYYNRTWESFTYETVLKKVIDYYYNLKSQKNDKRFILKQIESIAKNEQEKCEAWLKDFTKKYNSLSEETKETLRKKDIVFNTQEEAETVINTALLIDALK